MPEDVVLIFAYHFPPENAIGALRPYRLYKYLSRLGYECHVITAANLGQLPHLNGGTIIDPFLTEPRRGFGWQLERAIRKLLLPGAVGIQWAVHAYRAAVGFIDQRPGTRITIFSTYPPVGVHLAAYWLARRNGLPWIADFRDPLADNCVHDHVGKFPRSLYSRLEKLVVNSADTIIANTDAAQQKLKRAYPSRADRIQLIWNGFDPEDRRLPLPHGSKERKMVVHVGELYGGRSATPILQSIRRLICAGKLSPAEFQIYLAGPSAPGSIPNSNFVAEAAAEGWLRITEEYIPREEANRIIQTAHGLLLIQPQSVLQVPGKLYEYVQLGRPILALVAPDSPVERILSGSGVPYRCVYPSATQDEFDGAVFRFFQFAEADRAPNAWFESQFNAMSHAQNVAELIRGLHSAPVREPVLSHAAQD